MADRMLAYDILARDRASKVNEKVGRSFGGLSKSALAVGTAVGNLAASGVTALAGLAKSAVSTGFQTAAAMQQANIGFETLLGSAAKAKAYVADLSAFAAKTPFEFPGLVDASRLLLGVGVASKDVIPMLTDFGDAAGALSIKQDAFQRIMLATSQAISAGKFQVGDINQLMTNGLPAWTLLSKAMHKSVPELRDLASHGKLLAKDVLPALQSQMHKDYGGAMAKQSQTLSGLWSTLQDTFSQGMAQVVGPLVPILQKVLPGATAFLGKALSGAGKALDVFLGAITGNSELNEFDGKLKTLNNGALAVHDVFVSKIVPFWKGRVVPVLQAVGHGAQALGSWFKNDLWPAVMQGVHMAMPLFHKGLSMIRDAFKSSGKSGTDWKGIISAVGTVVATVAKYAIPLLAAGFVVVATNIKTLVWGIRNILWPALKFMAEISIKQMGFVVNAAASAFGWVPGLGPKLKTAAAQFNTFAEQVNGYLAGIPDQDVWLNIKMRQVGPGNRGLTRAVTKAQQIADLRHQATGGPTWPGGISLVGENGPEIVQWGGHGNVVPAPQTAAMLRGRGGAQVVHEHHYHFNGHIMTERQTLAYLDEARRRVSAGRTYVPAT